jgi:predicted amidohydrolase YtcJ
MTATFVLANGRFHTLNPARPFATALAIRGNTIIALGDDEAMRDLLAPGGRLVDCAGRTATPGLVDAHVHFQGFAQQLQRVNLIGTQSLAEAQKRIGTHLTHHPQNSWLLGRGWRIDAWAEKSFPTAAHLDEIVPHTPVFLRDHSGHAAWVNSRALRRAGINDGTPDPPGGAIQRDAAGRATGILFEAAMDLVRTHIPPLTPAELAAALRPAQEACWRAGLTGLHDFDGRSCLVALQMLHEAGDLGLRIVKNIPVTYLEHAVEIGLRSGFGSPWLRIGGVKMFADGALGPRTAAMIEPYENEPDNVGIVVTDKETMLEKGRLAQENGLSITVHAIGDRANHDVLDVYAALRKERTDHRLRHRIEHVQLLHPGDLQRVAQLGVIASMQPTHATSDMATAVAHWGSRTRYGYAWRTMLESGAALVFGSDAPIEAIDPLPGLHAAVTRRRADGTPGPEGWHPEQKLTLPEAVRAFTTAAAFTSGQEADFGMLAPGKLADITFFDRDLFAIPGDELLDVQIAGTMVDGRFRYRTW